MSRETRKFLVVFWDPDPDVGFVCRRYATKAEARSHAVSYMGATRMFEIKRELKIIPPEWGEFAESMFGQIKAMIS